MATRSDENWPDDSRPDESRSGRLSLWLLSLPLVLFATMACGDYWQGIYRAGPEVNSFQPCPGNLIYWVEGSSDAALALREYVLKHARRPFQPFYVELEGELLGKQRTGSAAGYDDVVRLRGVEEMSPALPPQCQDLPPEG
ncbi:MAG: hypothetical protein ACRCRW_01055 [Aeromonadaceae bacterium]